MDSLLDTPLGSEEFSSDFQLVKCVVVGDSGVGKTRLICARSCERKYSLPELMQTHVPTVWAIDQYRKNSHVLNSSWRTIDGVRVSLRLWDTFGYHDKDRRFAYGRADVVLICFSVVQPRSLRNVRKHWFSEVQQYCAGAPIIVCGCQTDLRHLYKDPSFTALDKGPFFREILDADVLLPDVGRNTAAKLGAFYYETSVLGGFGVEELFTNVIRAALISKRNRHFWMALSNLKHVGRPMLQAPQPVPRPKPPHAKSQELTVNIDFSTMVDGDAFVDVVFDASGVRIGAHAACLAVSSSVFCDLMEFVFSDKHSDSMHCCECIHEDCSTTFRLDHSVFESVTRSTARSDLSTLHVITLRDGISPAAFHVVLYFLYAGKFTTPLPAALCMEVHHLAEQLCLSNLSEVVANQSCSEDYLNLDICRQFSEHRCLQIKSLLLDEGKFADIEFQVDDGKVKAHRAILVNQSDVMAGMFMNDFLERSAKTIVFPGVQCTVFHSLLEYLYTGTTAVECVDELNSALQCMQLIEVANRLCQPSLVAHVEQTVMTALGSAAELARDVTEIVLNLLEPAQWHNAPDLASWCLWYLSVNYSEIYGDYSKVLYQLQPNNQIYLTKNQWPPLWYLKEVEIYEKKLIELQREGQLSVWRCLPFGGDGRVSCFGLSRRKRTKTTKTVLNLAVDELDCIS